MYNINLSKVYQPTQEDILEKYTEKEILEHYLQRSIRFNEMVSSPLRADKHPSCTYSYYNGMLILTDWSQDKRYSIWKIIQEKFGLANIYETFRFIYYNMGIADYTPDPIALKAKREEVERRSKSSKSNIEVKTIPLTKEDKEYLLSCGISEKTASLFNVYSISYAWINGKLSYVRSEEDPCLAYYFGSDEYGNQRWKLYFYKRVRGQKQARFICNTNRISGWIQIPDNEDLLVITKSHKDVMSLYELGISSISMQNEVTLPYDYIIEELQNRFTKVVSLYDFDRTGISMGNALKRKYGIQPIYLTNGRFGSVDYKAKDISDYIRLNGLDKTKSLINSLYDI